MPSMLTARQSTHLVLKSFDFQEFKVFFSFTASTVPTNNSHLDVLAYCNGFKCCFSPRF